MYMSAVMETKRWADLTEPQQKAVIVVFSELIRVKKVDVVHRIFNLANPEMVLTHRIDDTDVLTNFKITDESRKPFMVILNQYIKEAL
jgi:hypothetical protein